jgi:hypothetical protein
MPSSVGECASPFRHIYASKYTSYFVDLQALYWSIFGLSESRWRDKAWRLKLAAFGLRATKSAYAD